MAIQVHLPNGVDTTRLCGYFATKNTTTHITFSSLAEFVAYYEFRNDSGIPRYEIEMDLPDDLTGGTLSHRARCYYEIILSKTAAIFMLFPNALVVINLY